MQQTITQQPTLIIPAKSAFLSDVAANNVTNGFFGNQVSDFEKAVFLNFTTTAGWEFFSNELEFE